MLPPRATRTETLYPYSKLVHTNLVCGDMRVVLDVSSRAHCAAARPLGPGNYTLSNHLLDTPWPKTRRLRQALDGFPFEQLGQSAQPVFDILRDTTQDRKSVV